MPQSQPPPPADLDALGHLLMDQDKLDDRAATQRRIFHTQTMPRLRAGAFAMILGLAALHNFALFGNAWGTDLTGLALVLAGYSALSTLRLRAVFADGKRVALAEHLAWIDVALAGVVVYATGGPKSLLFFLPYARAFDTFPGRSARRLIPLFLAPIVHAGALVASALLGDAPFELWVEITKVVVCTLTGTYLVYGAESTRRVYRRQSAAIRYARELVRELREQSDALEESKREADGHARAKWASLTDVSQDLRTPASTIIKETEAALRTAPDGTCEVHLKGALAAAHKLLTNVEGVHRFSTLEAGRITVEHAPFRLRDKLTDVLSEHARSAQLKGLEVTCDIAHEVPEAVTGDASCLGEILDQLLSNAARFTGEGSIELRVAPGRAGWISFSVVDTGVGISAEKIELTFDPFATPERSTTRRFGGAGLGLAIARRLAEKLGGALSVSSVEGSGSTFTALIPLEEASGARSRAARPQALPAECRPGAVLVALRSKLTRESVARLVSDFGREPDTAQTPEEAMARAAAGPDAFCAIVCDDTLDVSDRQAIDRALEQRLDWIVLESRPGAGSPSASDGGVSPLRLHRLETPIVGPELFDALERATRPRGALPALEALPALGGLARVDALGPVAERQEPKTPHTSRPLDVLLVEDDALNRRVGRLLIESWGHRVEVASNGQLAVARTEERSFDVVLMDLQMPEMDGFEATRAIRARERADRSEPTYLVAMTGSATADDTVACKAAGMDGHIAKPIDRQELFERLEQRANELQRTP